MNEDTLGRALGAFRTTRMSEAASDRVREELQNAWRDRASRQTRRRGFVVPGFARAFAIAALVFAVGLGILRAGADSPLYGARIALEDGLVSLQADPVGYLGELYQERLEEAARLEATGNALAASRARDAQEDALRLLNKIDPLAQEEPPQPSPSTAITLPSPSPSPTPEPTVEPTPAPTPTPTLAPTPRPATPRPATAPPTVTDKPATPKPTPTPTPTQFAVHVTGTLTYADSTAVNDACVSLTLDGACMGTQVNGRFEFWIVAKKYDTITVYVKKVDLMSGRTLRGKDYGYVTGPTVDFGNTTLR